MAAGLTLPLFAFYALAFARNPAFAAWSAQNLLPASHPLQYAVAYSLFIALGAFALRWAWRLGRRHGKYILLITWVIAAFVLVYLPINVQRRMSEAVIVPLAILASHGLEVLIPVGRGRINRSGASPASLWFNRRLRRHPGRWRLAIIVLASLTSLVLVFTTIFGALSLAPPVFIPRAQLDAFAWLDSNAPPDARILTAMPTGNVLPAYTHLRPYVGHGPETLGALAKEAETERFYADAMSADERATLYASVDIRYVFYGANERALAGDSADAPAWAEGLTLVYEAGGVRIYRIQEDS
jgi:antibiotic biosynthesis monooxygenase (ABM) superfamily enzyme